MSSPPPARHVLVAEDSELNRVVAVAMLTEAGITVEIAENGQAAVEKATESPPNSYDAVLMDIQMPSIDGGSELDDLLSVFKRELEHALEAVKGLLAAASLL